MLMGSGQGDLEVVSPQRHEVRVTQRLELARYRLLRWNQHEIGDIFKHIEGMEVDIMELQYREDQEGSFQESDLRMLCHKLSVHHSLLRWQETLWRQKSRMQCIKEGDRNTIFFYQSMMMRSINHIKQLWESDGIMVEDTKEIKKQIFHLFRFHQTAQLGGIV